MRLSGGQKMVLASVALLLSVAFLTPKSKRRSDASGEGSGSLPRHSIPEDQRRSSHSPSPESLARPKTSGRSTLAAQIIPVYGFGILIYILYTLYKITSRGKVRSPVTRRITDSGGGHGRASISDGDLVHLQGHLHVTKETIERMVSAAVTGSHSGVSALEEQQLLHQLQDILSLLQRDSDLPEDTCHLHAPERNPCAGDNTHTFMPQSEDGEDEVAAMTSLEDELDTGSDLTTGLGPAHFLLRHRNRQ